MTQPAPSTPTATRPTPPPMTADSILTEVGATATLNALHAQHDQAPAQAAELVSLVRLSDVQPERIDWLWPGYLARGKLHVIDGDPGLGKSTLTADLAARITTGAPWPDAQPGCLPAGVVLLSAEDGLADTIRPRLDAADADVERVVALTGVRYLDPDAGEVLERMPVLPRDIGRIRYAVQQVGATLVVIDPLMAYLGSDINSYRDQDVRRGLAPLARMAEDCGAAVILVRHLTKGGGPNAIYRGGGSIGIIGAARIGYTVVRDPDDDGRVIVAGTKANIAVMPPSLAYRLVSVPEHGCARVEWDTGPVSYTAVDLLAAATESPDERGERRDAVDWLRCYLIDQGGCAAVAEIMKAAKAEGISERTVRRARVSIGATIQRGGFPSRSDWQLDPGQSGHR
jgi:hypothetical protein